ncbi:Nose resistant to fluoxetine protein 6 [Holothuria leucospilota]|uniref:Nose resistant to fluoxetine protein 6 n=1 Tax=Holothuria leucospilota TaxID=206669 RepID=A0A9Q1BRN0_HOLLE|nr:Nose resistant to fluoxetine protein 6 [Holothuria leucospilota]
MTVTFSIPLCFLYRLLPILVATLLIYVFIMPHLMWGPRAPYYAANPRKCATYWWATMLFINNIYPHMNDQCMEWTWYLANDLQFFAFSPLFIYAFFRNPLVGFGLLSLLLSICMGATGFLVACVDYTLPLSYTIQNPAADLIYRAPFARVSPYLIGILVGFVLFKYKTNKTTFPRVSLLSQKNLTRRDTVLTETIVIHYFCSFGVAEGSAGS